MLQGQRAAASETGRKADDDDKNLKQLLLVVWQLSFPALTTHQPFLSAGNWLNQLFAVVGDSGYLAGRDFQKTQKKLRFCSYLGKMGIAMTKRLK